MSAQPILQCTNEAENSVLRTESAPVPDELFNTAELSHIITDMIDTLDGQPDGVALAAPQIGISYRIFIVRYDRTLPPSLVEGISEETNFTAETKKELIEIKKADVGVFINPQFIKSSRRRVEMDEGCLSVRGIYGTTYRHDRATVRAQDQSGTFFERGAGGLLAQIFQHEIDHLNGILFIDHAIELTRSKSAAVVTTEETKENDVALEKSEVEKVEAKRE